MENVRFLWVALMGFLLFFGLTSRSNFKVDVNGPPNRLVVEIAFTRAQDKKRVRVVSH